MDWLNEGERIERTESNLGGPKSEITSDIWTRLEYKHASYMIK